MKLKVTFLIGLPCLLALGATAGPYSQGGSHHLDLAVAGGLEPNDFHHLYLAFAWRHTETDWRALDASIRRLELVTSDPLMSAELKLLRARMEAAEGRADRAREAFRSMGGLERWWTTESLELPELEDFDESAQPPDQDARWRPVPDTDASGWVRLEGVDWPIHRRLLFLATTLESNRRQPVALRLGAAEVARAWINGEEVLSTDFPLDRSPDQAAGGAWLRKGANTLVVAVGTETGDWWLRARVTQPDGSPLTGVTERDDEPRLLNPVGASAPEVRTVESAIRTAVDRGDEQAKLALAAYLVDRRPFPRTSGAAREACNNAREVEPALARLFEWLVTTEPNRRRQLLAEALDSDDTLTAARIGLARWYSARGLYEEASKLLQASEDPWSEAVRIDLDFEQWGPLALHDLARLSRKYPGAVEVGILTASRALDARWWPLAREVLSRLEEFTPGISGVAEIRERLAQECGDVAELRDLLRTALKQDPNRPGLRIRVARAAMAEGETDEAVSVLEVGLERCPRHPDLLLELAGVEHLRGEDDRALALTTRLLDVRPQDRQAQRLHELLGGESEDRSWLRTPPQLWEMVDRIDSSAEPAVTVLRHTEIRFLPGNSTEERVQKAVLVNVAEQADDQLRHTVPYVPERQRLRVLSARVLRRDGTVVNAGRGETPRLSDPEFNMYYDTRLRVLQFQELEDGDLIELSYVLSETAEANDTGPYKGGIVRLAGELPVHRTELLLEGPVEFFPEWELVHLGDRPHEETIEQGWKRASWSWNSIPALPREIPRAPSLLVTPYLVYSNHASWTEISDWYSRHIQPRIRVSPQLEELANRLVRGAESRKEMIAAIYRYATNDIRYVGLELGEHRFRPFSASWVQSHKIGDCKDKAALLMALFKIVGIPAQMVLVRTSDLGPVPSKLAVLEVFNHAIAYLPEDGLWLDGTASGQDPFVAPGLDQGSFALVVNGSQASPEIIPVKGGGLTKIYCRLERGDGAREVTVELRTEDTGDAATKRRTQLFGSRNPQRFARWLQNIFPGAELVGEAELDMPPGRDPAHFAVRGKMPTSVLSGSGGVQTYPGRLRLASALAPVSERTTPILIPIRPDLEWKLEVLLDIGDEVLPGNIAIESEFGDFELSYEADGAGYTVQGWLHLEPGLVDPESVPELRSFLLSVEEAMGRRVEVQ